MGIGDWIPQVVYDLIGRVLPGAFLLFLSALLIPAPERTPDLVALAIPMFKAHQTMSVLASIVLAYMVGTLLGAIGFAFENREWTANRNEDVHVAVPSDAPSTKTLSRQDRDALASFKYDSIILHDPSAGARLVKLRAERHLCRVLIVGVCLLLFLHWLVEPFRAWHQLQVLLALATIGVSAYWFHVHLDVRSRRLVENYWYLLGRPTRRL